MSTMINRVRWALLFLCCAQEVIAAAPRVPSDSLYLSALTWREVGPPTGGRVTSVSGSAARPREYYAATAGGGIFKTVNAGLEWLSVSDGYFGGSMGAIAVSPSNPDVVYAGGGQTIPSENASPGDGLYKSDDAGGSWKRVGLADSQNIARIAIHPADPDIVYVAAFGHLYDDNVQRGVFKSKDGGKTWERILFRDASTGARDVALVPGHPEMMYASLEQVRRTPWSLQSRGSGSGIFESTDSGAHWTELTHAPGLPQGSWGNVSLAISPAQPTRVWVFVDTTENPGIYRSDDAGAHWQLASARKESVGNATAFHRVIADPRDPDTLYCLGVWLERSTDGGRTFTYLTDPHVDNTDLWIAPHEPQRMILGSDGGATVSFDGGMSWSAKFQRTSQMYHVGVTSGFPYKICGAQQDASSACGPSRRDGGIDASAWQNVAGNEWSSVVGSPDDPHMVYSTAISFDPDRPSSVTRTKLTTGARQRFDLPKENQRVARSIPIAFSPFDHHTLYVGTQSVIQSLDDGETWRVISPDLTRNDAEKGNGTSATEAYAVLLTVAPSKAQPGVIWTGSDDGYVFVTSDDGKTWLNVTPPALGGFTRVATVEPSPFDSETAYVAANRYRLGDFRPLIFKATHSGRDWTEITAGLPADEFVRVVRADPVRKGVLYAGTERGVWVSLDDGALWQPLQTGLPHVAVHDMQVVQDDIVIATHGRGFWILDDISPLRQLSDSLLQQRVALLQPKKVFAATFSAGDPGRTPDSPVSRNPAAASFYYWLAKPARSVKLAVVDTAGKSLIEFNSDAPPPQRVQGPELMQPKPYPVPTSAGLSIVPWNLRLSSVVAALSSPPLIEPGIYTLRLTVDGVSRTQPFEVLKDPRALGGDGGDDADDDREIE
jgi:photosystem II stability/assembly factor-like uncharacterized protein